MFYFCMMSDDDKHMQNVIANALNKRYTDVYAYVEMVKEDLTSMEDFLIDCTKYLADVYGMNVDVEINTIEDGEYPFHLGFSEGGKVWYNKCAIKNMFLHPEQYESIVELLLMLPIHELRHEVQSDAVYGRNIWKIDDYRINAWRHSHELRSHVCDRITHNGYKSDDSNHAFYNSLAPEQDAIKFTWGCIDEIERRHYESHVE